MNSDDLKSYANAWNDHDIDGLLRFFSDDLVYRDAAMDLCYRGKDELRSFLEKVFASSNDCRFETKEVVMGEQGGFWEWVYSGTMTGDFEHMACDHKPFSWKGVSVMEFRDGQVARVTDYCLMGEIPNW